MFGNKNSAVPYVRIGGVDRQSVLTSNANGNTPVKEIGVNANGNLVFSTDLATFKSVLDLKYSQFKSNDENQDDTWETEKSVSMRANGTLEDGTAKESGVIVSKEFVAMVNASMKDDTSTVSQISVSNNDATIYSNDGNSVTYLTVTPTGAKVNDKEIATKDDIPQSISVGNVIIKTSGQIWRTKTWNGLSRPSGNNIWTDGDNIYYSFGTDQYVLDKSTSTWNTKTWNGLSGLNGSNIWTDGDNIYFSSGISQDVLDKSTSTWNTKTWNGLSEFDCSYIWTDGDNIYYSNGTDQYVLKNYTTSTKPI